MNTTILENGVKRHTLNGWVGIQQPDEPIAKTKWRRTDSKYWNINGYTITQNKFGTMTCECKGFYFRKKCRHIEEAKNG
tara:strand:- start:550 stop:786 length:237 start_codon:yes stop_codon:yes gene_type:complete